MRRMLAVAVVVLCSGCAREQDDAIAAIFDRNPKPPVYVCISVANADPSARLLNLAKRHNPKVLPASQCHRGRTRYQTASGQPAEAWGIDSLEWHGRNKVRITLTSGRGESFGSSGWSYTVEKLSGVWIVTAEDMEWIS
ncbi:hypothetical protein [Lysobacter sp. HA35]